MKKIILTTLLLITVLSSSLYAQQISSVNYDKEFIHEDFNQEGEYFNIETTNDNYFILDKGDYLLSRNNNESEFAIIANNSSVSNFILKTSVRLGPSNNKQACIGIVLKAQQDGKGAIIFEINKKGEYRIKQLLGNVYKRLSGVSKNEGWVKSKTINGVDEHNYIEIRTEDNIYDVYVNSDYLTTFFIPDYTSGSCGLIISPETKARIAYYHINTKSESTTSTTNYANKNKSNIKTTIEELNRKTATLEENNAKLNSLNSEARENQEKELKILQRKNTNQSAITIEKEKEIIILKRSIADLKNSNSRLDGLENTIIDNTTLINNLISEKEQLSNEVNNLTKTLSILNTKNTDLADVTIEQEKEINTFKNSQTNSNASIANLEAKNQELNNKITALNTKNTDFADVTIEQEKEIQSLKLVNTDLKNKGTNDLNKANKSSNSKILKLNTKINSLKNQINTINKELNLANKTGALLKKSSENAAKLNYDLINANEKITVLENIKIKHDNIVIELNNQISLLKEKQLNLNSEMQVLNKKTSNLEITNIELKELFIIKDFEVNGIKPSELTKQTNTSSKKEELKNNSKIYAVQFGVFMKVQAHSKLNILDEVWYETTENGNYVYLSGQFKTPQEATAHKKKVSDLGYPNSFVVTLTK